MLVLNNGKAASSPSSTCCGWPCFHEKREAAQNAPDPSLASVPNSLDSVYSSLLCETGGHSPSCLSDRNLCNVKVTNFGWKWEHPPCLYSPELSRLPELSLLQPFVRLVSSLCKICVIIYCPLAPLTIILIYNALTQSRIIQIIYPFTIFFLPINKYSLVCAVHQTLIEYLVCVKPSINTLKKSMLPCSHDP